MDNTERIDRYLHGAMTAIEREAFEADVQSDVALAGELRLQQEMEQFLLHKEGRHALQQQLATIGTPYFQEDTGLKTIYRRPMLWVAVAAAAAIALIFVWPALFPGSLYEEYARHPVLALTEKASGAVTDWSVAEKAFNSGNYTQAEPLLRQYLEQFPDDQQVQLYLGICKLELDRLPEARTLFLGISAPDLRDYAIWYLALADLKEGKNEACLQQLKAIPDTSPFYNQARELMEQLQ